MKKGTLVYEIGDAFSYWTQLLGKKVELPPEEKIIYGKHKHQYFLRFSPNPLVKKRNTAIVHFHGGGWKIGRPEYFRHQAKVLTDMGFTVYMPCYRRIPKYNAHDIDQDLKLCLLRFQEFLPNMPFILGGISAGGQLAARVVYDKNFLLDLQIATSTIRGIYTLSAPLDMRHMRYKRYVAAYAGMPESDLFLQVNPADLLSANDYPPLLCVHGADDPIVSMQCSVSFVERLQAIQSDAVEFQIVPNRSHFGMAKWYFDGDIVRRRLTNWLGQFD